MSVAYAVRSHYKKLAKLGSIFRRDFNSSKCKTWAKMTTARIKLLRNKRETVVRQMRRDVALLLQSGQDATARIRVEHVIREQNMMAANEIIELFCERIVTRLSIIAKQRECPADLKEAISSLIFAGPRCSDIPELLAIRDIFQKKYGKDFVSAATDLRPNSGVNRLLIEKLSALNPTGELKLKVMKEIAKEYQVQWDTTETEKELLKPLEERIDGPQKFVSATSLPLNTEAPIPKQATSLPHFTSLHSSSHHLKLKSYPSDLSLSNSLHSSLRLSGGPMTFQDAASAAKAAADSAKDALAAAQAAAQLAQSKPSDFNHNNFNRSKYDNSTPSSGYNHVNFNGRNFDHSNSTPNPGVHGRYEKSQSLGMGNNDGLENADEMRPDVLDLNRRRHSYNVQRANTDIQFDESDCVDEDIDMEERHAESNANSGVHPKLPDYDTLSARFEALKHHKT